jgi:hypothetical protein
MIFGELVIQLKKKIIYEINFEHISLPFCKRQQQGEQK